MTRIQCINKGVQIPQCCTSGQFAMSKLILIAAQASITSGAVRVAVTTGQNCSSPANHAWQRFQDLATMPGSARNGVGKGRRFHPATYDMSAMPFVRAHADAGRNQRSSAATHHA